MAQRTDIRYIQYYTDGSAARKIAPASLADRGTRYALAASATGSARARGQLLYSAILVRTSSAKLV